MGGSRRRWTFGEASHAVAVVAAAAAVALAAGPAAAARVWMAVHPATVAAGGAVRVVGNAGRCPRGDDVVAISRAFPGREFGAMGALRGPVRAHGSFVVRGRVRRDVKPGRYVVTARCGGGNLGVSAVVRVRRR